MRAFVSLLGLLLDRVVEREARRLGRRESLSALLDLLGKVRLAMGRPSDKEGGQPQAEWQLEQMDEDVAHSSRHLVPTLAPFVYTDGSA